MSGLPDGVAGRTPEEVLAFLRTASDHEVRDRVHEIGTGVVLDLVFDGWAERFAARPGRAPGVLAFELDDDGTLHRQLLSVDEGGARHVDDGAARATMRTTLVRFLRVAAGAQDPKLLVLTGRLRLGGDAMWAVTALAGSRRS